MMTTSLPYDPQNFPREMAPFYISAGQEDLNKMLKELDFTQLDDVFSHLPQDVLFEQGMRSEKKLDYPQLVEHMQALAGKTHLKTSFVGDGLGVFSVPPIVSDVCQIRGLTTAYTPYQPERGQGTLWSLWLYSSALSMLTGMEAINASLYDRSTCLFEAINTAFRLSRQKKPLALVCASLYPGDLEVLETLRAETALEILYVPYDQQTGTTDLVALKALLKEHQGRINSLAFGQVNSFGLLENVHQLQDLASEHQIQSIAVIDPLLLGHQGLCPPSQFGTQKQGASMIVGEGQHLALSANFGGPGLGIFGIRFNEKNKLDIRSTPGRYVGKTKDFKGREALCMVMSTREQHIRREKATSNICSNQSFLATIVGASLLAKGDRGLAHTLSLARQNATTLFEKLTQLPGVRPAFGEGPFFNQFCLQLPKKITDVQKHLSAQGLHLGVDISGRLQERQGYFVEISCSDLHTPEDLDKLVHSLAALFGEGKSELACKAAPISEEYLRKEAPGIPQIPHTELLHFYQQLGELNVSPDDNIYPLGSCTMKYNPYINDWAAGLAGFSLPHPQAPEEDVQGPLELLFHIQEMFKKITGLAGVTTQPVAGAQGELVGLKMFQAYHRSRGEEGRDIVLIPRSAHGTNPATATMAGLETKTIGGVHHGIVTIEANAEGHIDWAQLTSLIQKYGERLCGIMVTNPNTAGLFETKFKEMAELVHQAGGLVYMDGANMNAIAGYVDLGKLGVDAVHNNLHKTWTIPHGGGGPGDAIVAVSEKLVPFLPGVQVEKRDGLYRTFKAKHSIGSFHRHFGNFAHKVRCYTYIKALGDEGIKKMSAVAVLSAQYLYHKLKDHYPTLPRQASHVRRMHEFIVTLPDELFAKIEAQGIAKPQIIARVGKLFLDFGMHAPTVAFPEPFGLMIEPTESFSKKELDRFVEVMLAIKNLLISHPNILHTVPHFTPIDRVDEVGANKELQLYEKIQKLPTLLSNRLSPADINSMDVSQIVAKILQAHRLAMEV